MVAPLARTSIGIIALCGALVLGGLVQGQFVFAAEPRKSVSDAQSAVKQVTWPLKAIDVDSHVYRLGDSPTTNVWAFVFLSPRCERSGDFITVLNRLYSAHSDSHIELFAVISDSQVDHSEARAWRDREKVRMTVLFDGGGILASELGATHTPQAVVVDAAGKVMYSGKIDDRPDRPGDKRARPKHMHLAAALQALSMQRAPTVRRTDPVGRLIKRQSQADFRKDVNWSRHIAPLMSMHCGECHHVGGMAPFPLTTFAEVRPHAHAIVSLLKSRTMPPWKPLHGFGEFQNVRRLAPSEIELFSAWVENKMPLGDVNELFEPVDYGDGWFLGEPDLVLYPPEPLDVVASSEPTLRSFAFPTHWEDERLVTAIEFRSARLSQVEQATVVVDLSRTAQSNDQADPLPGFDPRTNPTFDPISRLGGWAPMTVPSRLPVGTGRPLPQYSDVVLQIQYRASGKDLVDLPRLGIYLAEETARRPVGEIAVADVKLKIPPGAARHRHRARYNLPTTTTVLGITPHLRELAREVTVVAYLPDGSMERLLRIEQWDPKWHDHYQLRRPLRLPSGSHIEMEAVFDNSARNPRVSEKGPVLTKWGDGPGTEKAICFLQVSADNPTEFADLINGNQQYIANQFSPTVARPTGPVLR